ncbi:MAG: Glu-tRNA(Gln) amidotransferase subunit GatD [Nitrososphaerota archaeon]|nr:Glu-tRNA(Gln) amidotransferase subunit GatD [Candidatus Bathyarchaeota archaeon]MDW8048865.1 Glu-tRNA(Gln) amidotransferase subunit GatD [Nitrososphaerota archaeon]
MDWELPGYRGEALRLLKESKVKIGDRVRILREDTSFEGILIPRSEYGDDKHIVIKIKSGYNIGIKITPATRIEKIGVESRPSFSPPPPPPQRPDLPRVAIIGTGGTIASRVDYRTGAVRPAISASDLYSIIPELSEIAAIETDILFNVFSEDLTPAHWSGMAKKVADYISKGVDGVVITHGTDAMGYTAAALSFALQNLPVPVILVGAQRSEDRPSSDAATNMIGAVLAASQAPFAEVAVAMHETISDDSVLLHRGTKVRKCHTSRRDAFKTVNGEPLARILENRGIEMLTENFRERDKSRILVLKPDFDEKVALIKFYPGMNPKVIDWHVEEGYLGIILEGTGLGHIRRECFESIRNALKDGVIIAMTSQCIWGRVNMNVYSNGRDLLTAGVIPLEDMLPETALVKLMWILGQTKNQDEVRSLLKANIANEISPRSIESIQPHILSRI